MGQENQTQKMIGFITVGRKTRPKDHIWAKTIYGIRHSGTGKSDPKDDRIQHSWQENQTQRPYMGKDHIWDSTQLDSTQLDRETRPKDHIWAKTIYGIQHSWDKETGPKDSWIQHSWDRETRPKDHIWAKTIYGIQHSGTRKPDPKTIYGI